MNSAIALTLGRKARINHAINFPAKIESAGFGNEIILRNYVAMSWGAMFEVGLTGHHNYSSLTSFAPENLDWEFSEEDVPAMGNCKIEIGNDVWIGRGCTLKCSNPKKPLVIGDGAVVASDSVVVKNIPPYAIVGGNPAQIIKYRFPQKIIEGLLRIKWWDWDIDKIHDNFKYFTRVEEFVEMHDVSG